MGDRRPFGRRRSSGFDRYGSRNHRKGGGERFRSGRACVMIVTAALVGGMLCSWLSLRSNMVLSVRACATAVVSDGIFMKNLLLSACYTAGSVSCLKPFSYCGSDASEPRKSNHYLFES